MDFFASDQLILPSQGDLLISEPYLPDPNFERTVIFLCAHDENGSFGLVLNQSTNLKLEEYVDGADGFEARVNVGGPVERDTLHYLHRSEKLASSSRSLGNGIYWGGNFEQIISLINTKELSAQDIIFFVGYAGWASDQLENELKAKSWIVHKNASHEMIFDWSNQSLWKMCLENMGGKYRLMSNYPTDPTLN